MAPTAVFLIRCWLAVPSLLQLERYRIISPVPLSFHTSSLPSRRQPRHRSPVAWWEGFYEPFPLQSNCFPDGGGRPSEFRVQTPSFGAPSLTSGCSSSAFVFGSAHCDRCYFFLGGVSGSRVCLVLITASRERSWGDGLGWNRSEGGGARAWTSSGPHQIRSDHKNKIKNRRSLNKTLFKSLVVCGWLALK